MDSPVIFVVDDDAFVRKAVRRLLLSLHLPVQLFASAEQFLAATQPTCHGCLILDLHLPGLSGLELQDKLVDQGWNLPVVIVTAHDEPAARDAALGMGAVAFIKKPFDRAQFLAIVQAAMTQKQT
jgi:FixJ family two-component response regulator